MPNNQDKDDDSDYRLPEELLEGEESKDTRRITRDLYDRVRRNWDKFHIEQLKEQRDTGRWKLGLTIAITAALTFMGTNLANNFFDLQSELREIRERLMFLETIHSDKHFQPVHVHPTRPTDKPVNESRPPAQGK